MAQRIAMRYHLEGLNQEEAAHYIKHCLEIAGGEYGIFVPPAAGLIFERTGGIPRRINQVCDMCLFTGFAKKVKIIDEEIVREAISSL